MKTYLNDEEIIEAIKNYLDNTIYNYAVLIDGDWGCGKTYFVKQKLFPTIEAYEQEKKDKSEEYKQKKVIYISLYGVENTNEISKMIYVNIYNFMSKSENKIARKIGACLGTGVKMISDVVQNFFGADTEQAIMDILQTFEMKDYVIIFDDLERCNCDVNILLGYINNFVEHDGTKIILVANEREIGSAYSCNQELRYMVCANSDIDFEQIDGINLTTSRDKRKTSEEKEKVSVSKLKDRADELFDDEETYCRIKEKLIGLTIRYFPDFEEIIKALTQKNIKDDNIKTIILNKVPEIINLTRSKGHYNFRTYQFFLSKINKLGAIMQGKYEDILDELVEYIYSVCLDYKSGKYSYEWKEEDIYQEIPLYGRWRYEGYRIGFRFVDEFVLYEKIDAHEISTHIDYYLQQKKEKEEKQKQKDILEALYSWWEKTEEEVRDAWTDVQKSVDNNEVSIKEYPNIVSRVITLVNAGFEQELLDKLISSMKINIENSSGEISLDEHNSHFMEAEERKRYNEVMEELRVLVKKKKDEQQGNIFDTMLEDESKWGKNLFSWIEANDNKLSLEERNFIRKIDISKLLHNIEKSDNYNVCMFRYAINKVYNFSNISDYYREDYPYLQMLYEKIDALKGEYDILKQLNISLLKRTIEEKMELLK